jgi:hypothetical protein
MSKVYGYCGKRQKTLTYNEVQRHGCLNQKHKRKYYGRRCPAYIPAKTFPDKNKMEGLNERKNQIRRG